MAACGSLLNPLSENPTLLESLSSRNQIKPIDQSLSFTEIFGELHFKENSLSSSSSSSSFSLADSSVEENNSSSKGSISEKKSYCSSSHKSSDSFSSLNWESLQLCTEGLGSESSDDVEDLKGKNCETKEEEKNNIFVQKQTSLSAKCLSSESIKRTRKNWGAFPPPISCIGTSGKPWVCFKSYRHDGRFVLKEIRIPTQEFLQACREDGRLKLQFVQPNEEIFEEEDDEELGGDEENESEKEKEGT